MVRVGSIQKRVDEWLRVVGRMGDEHVVGRRVDKHTIGYKQMMMN